MAVVRLALSAHRRIRARRYDRSALHRAAKARRDAPGKYARRRVVLGGGIERPPGQLSGIQSRRSDDDLPQNEHELRVGAVGGAAYLLRRPLSKRGVAALDVASRHRA